ncbi:33533_t:CDS:2 [Gigaspora margarita]|uniref:33533_t:CDS:1 n=1 Tax=Gigaspora margarita TaxID=4874 RepID=A0ABN7UV64_GIGMA|nr:33533_t:CDS:2 [Gigaspora margarita]
MIDSKIFIRESYDDDYWTRYFRKKDIQKLYKLFLEQVIPIAKRIMETSFYPNDEVLYKELFGHYSVITDPSIQEIIDGDCKFFIGGNEIIPDFIVFVVEYGKPFYGATFFLNYLESIPELRYENINQIFVNYVNSLPLE